MIQKGPDTQKRKNYQFSTRFTSSCAFWRLRYAEEAGNDAIDNWSVSNHARWENLSDKGRRGKTLEKPAREGLDLDQEILNTSQSLEQDIQYRVQQAELVARCLHGDEQAFAHIVEQYGDVLFRTAYLLVHDEEAAKDVVQDALLLAWKICNSCANPVIYEHGSYA